MKANIKKGKSWDVDEGPAEYEKEIERGDQIVKIKRSNKKVSIHSKKFKKVANRKVRYENFIDEENKGKTEKEMALEELESGIKNILETAVEEEFKSCIDKMDKKIPEGMELDPEELERVAEKAFKEWLKGLPPSEE